MSHFNNVSNSWDTEEKIQSTRNLADKIKKEVKLKDNLKILDFGCGTGLLGFEFVDAAKSLLGVDTSLGMLEVFDSKSKDYPHIKSLNINLEENQLAEKFDLIISSMAFHHLNDPGKVLKSFSNMLSDGGIILIVDLESEDGTFHPNNEEMGVKHFGFSNEELKKWSHNSNLNLNVKTIDSIYKNEKEYNLFLAIYR